MSILWEGRVISILEHGGWGEACTPSWNTSVKLLAVVWVPRVYCNAVILECLLLCCGFDIRKSFAVTFAESIMCYCLL